MDIEHAIAHRRTHKVFSGAPIDDDTLRALIQAAIWAPNHRHTEPWRFGVVRGDRRADLADAIDGALQSKRKPDASSDIQLAAKKRQFRRRIAQAGAIIAITWRRSPDDPTRDREDYAATACAVQNMQLCATGRGLVCLWSTAGIFKHPLVGDLLGIEANEGLAAILFVGHPTLPLEGRRLRGVDDVTRWL